MNSNTKARRRALYKQRAQERQERRRSNKRHRATEMVEQLKVRFTDALKLIARSGSNLRSA